MTSKRRTFLAGLAAATTTLASARAWAQSFPSKPVRFIVPFAAGGNADVTARLVGEGMSRKFGQLVVVDNRPGAGGVVGQELVLQAPADGYTMVISAFGPLYVSPLMAGKPSMIPSFAPVGMLSTVPMIVVVPATSRFADWPALLAAAKAKPGTISYGTPPAAGMGHMAGEELQRRAGIKLIHAPYRGGADAARDIGAGAIDSVIITTNSIRPPVAAGRARVLAVTSLKRSSAFPNAPTLNESGYPGFDLADWNGMFAATGTPMPVVERMQAVIAETVKDAKVKERLDPTGADLVANTPAEFKTWMAGQRDLLGKLIVEADIKLQ